MGRFISDETRRRLATGWDPRVSTLSEYARQNGVSERAIRNWRARLRHDGGTTEPGGSDDAPLHAVVDALRARLGELEAAVDSARATVASARALLDSVQAETGDTDSRQPTSAEVVPPPASRPAEPTAVPMPIPRPGVFW